MALKRATAADVRMPDVGEERKHGIAVGRRVVVGQYYAHLVQVAEDGLARRLGVLNADYRLAAVPYLELCRQAHGVLAADDVRQRRLERVGAVGLTLAADGVELLPTPGTGGRRAPSVPLG